MMLWYLRYPASYLPEWLLKFLGRHWQPMYDPTDGWHLWIDASYLKWCRKDKRRNS